MPRVPPPDRTIQAFPFFRHEYAQMASHELRCFLSLCKEAKGPYRCTVHHAKLSSQRVLGKRAGNGLSRLADSSREKIQELKDMVCPADLWRQGIAGPYQK